MAAHEGAVYAVAGSSGQATGGALNHPAMFVSLNSLGSLVLDVNGNRLDAAFLDQAGVRRDYFTILKGAVPTGSTPFGRTAAMLPGTIEAEKFDNGGADVAYRDTTSRNSGGAYRTTDVDIGRASDSGGGYYVGWTRAGEWLKYTVNVTRSCICTLDVRLAGIGTGARFHVEVDGVDVTGPMAVPHSGGWQTWRTISKAGISLSAGTRIVRLVFDAGTIQNSGAGNYNQLTFR
jgi:hypothetical protein